jgi:hypothetical protein
MRSPAIGLTLDMIRGLLELLWDEFVNWVCPNDVLSWRSL